MDTNLDSARDRHLFGPGPKRILALGGSASTAMSAAIFGAFLERIETVLGERSKPELPLGDHFDLVGGASTGAVIAGAVALGYRARQIKDFLLMLAPVAFKRQNWRVPLLQAKFDARGLRKQIETVVGDRALSSPDLITGLSIIIKRVDTGSPWIVSNNPRAPYWEGGGNYIGNKDYPLVNLVRASTAAPHFFDPELLPLTRPATETPSLDESASDSRWPTRAFSALMQRLGLRKRNTLSPDLYGLFVDGTLTPHANPSLALLDLATLSPFHLKWPTGPERLTVCSVGAGRHRYQPLATSSFAKSVAMTFDALTSLLKDAEDSVLGQMQYLGECPTPWPVPGTGIGADDMPRGGKVCRFLHYDVELEEDWIRDNLGLTVSARDISRLRQLDDPAVAKDFYHLAEIAAEKQVKPEHFS